MNRTTFTLLMCASLAATAAEGEREGDYWYVQTSAHTLHWNPDPEHNNRQRLIGIERVYTDGLLWGGATFKNSFNQRSHYAYLGKVWENARYPLYAKLSAGLVHGYRGEYADRIPLNGLGVAPVIIPSIGAHWGPVGAEFVVLGTAAAMVNVGLRF
ncbi:sn-glycerol-3-phosphate transporter [Pseudomonas sp. NPDC089752]|uniref:sn-glycerol-3-phosphate transporter n=1 Tax=Pseudomonas sp. NPDC089752 TaxID=3364472 RepID=UPI00380D0344